MVKLCKRYWIISLTYIFFKFESDLKTYPKGPKALIWLVFSSILKVNVKLMQNFLNHQFGLNFLQFWNRMVLIWLALFSLLKVNGKLMQKLLNHQFGLYFLQFLKWMLICLIFSSGLKVNGKLMRKVMNHYINLCFNHFWKWMVNLWKRFWIINFP